MFIPVLDDSIDWLDAHGLSMMNCTSLSILTNSIASVNLLAINSLFSFPKLSICFQEIWPWRRHTFELAEISQLKHWVGMLKFLWPDLSSSVEVLSPSHEALLQDIECWRSALGGGLGTLTAEDESDCRNSNIPILRHTCQVLSSPMAYCLYWSNYLKL